MTETDLPKSEQALVARHALDVLPRKFHKTTKVHFHTGSVRRLVAERFSQKLELDPICEPRNPYLYQHAMMGDSVGLALNQGDDHSTSTLGSCLLIEDVPYWLLNFHPFEEAIYRAQTPRHNMVVEHPSADDRHMCHAAGHTSLTGYVQDFGIGKLKEISGPNKSTTRTSRNSYWALAGIERPKVIMDWALCTARSPQINTIRQHSSGVWNTQNICSTISLSEESGGAPVYSMGRTSGLRRGQIGLSPELVSTKVTGAQTKTMEWFVEEPYPYDNEGGLDRVWDWS